MAQQTICDKCGKIVAGVAFGFASLTITVKNGAHYQVDIDVREVIERDMGASIDLQRRDFCQGCYREIVTRGLSDRIQGE